MTEFPATLKNALRTRTRRDAKNVREEKKNKNAKNVRVRVETRYVFPRVTREWFLTSRR